MSTARKQDTRERGAALILALGYLTVITFLAAGFLGMVRYAMDASAERQRAARAMALAEAGLDKAVAELRVSPDYEGEQDTPLGSGRFSVRVERAGGQGSYRVVAEGLTEPAFAKSAHARIEAAVGLSGRRVQRLVWREATSW